MNIVEIVEVVYPGAIEAGLVSFRKPEEDILIAYWGLEDPQPTEQELLDIQDTEEFQELAAKKERKDHNAPILTQLDALDLKSIRAIRENDTEYLEMLTQQALALRAQLL